MICKKCGKELADDVKFCGVCGTPVSTLTDYTAPLTPPVEKAAEPLVKDQPQSASAPMPKYHAASSAAGYAPNSYAPGYVPGQKDPLTTGQFLVMDLLMLVPVVNIVLLILWGFGADANANRKSWARSRLIWLGIGLVFTIFCLIVALAAM